MVGGGGGGGGGGGLPASTYGSWKHLYAIYMLCVPKESMLMALGVRGHDTIAFTIQPVLQ